MQRIVNLCISRVLHHSQQLISMMQNIVQKERSRSQLSSDTLGCFLYGENYYLSMKRHLQNGPVLDYTPNIFNKSRLDLVKDAYRYLPIIYNYNSNHSDPNLHPHMRTVYSLLVNPHQIPGLAHFGMFIKYIELMGTEEHRRLYLDKAISCEIVGCYAQTEVGHGSDIRSLQTEAEYDVVTKQWVINSPTTSSAKYWPGELSILANYALVFAQTIIKGKNYGVHPFLVQIKDKDYNWLPGIQGGDIGPKIGFHAKENGYMYLRNIRVPKNNLFTKYVEVTDCGQYKQIGDPRVGYGTMMFIRQLISCAVPKIYAQAIIISARYSLFRKQGVDKANQEVTILDYQTQQDKILPRIAEYYAITLAGTKIREVGEQNNIKVVNGDFSLINQTHSNLAFSKGLFSELAHDGIQVMRRSIGGHGTSYYSGMPQLMNQFAANNTHEGENTVMYLQSARYVLKSYLNYVTKGKPLADSVKYIARFQDLSAVSFTGKNTWTVQQLRDLVVRALSYIIGLVGTRIAGKEKGELETDIINYKVGIRLQQLAQLHAVHFMLNEFLSAIDKETNRSIKPLLEDLYKIFAIGQIQRLAEPIIEGGFVCPNKWILLNKDKQTSLKRIRPHVAVLLESFGIPDKYVRSQLVRGSPYENYLNKARECDINTSISKSALQVSKIREVLAAKPRL